MGRTKTRASIVDMGCLPKSKYVRFSYATFGFGTYNAVAHFNIGMRSFIMISTF